MRRREAISRFFKNLLYPPKCVSCGAFTQKDILDPCELPFCEKCRVKWELEKLDRCPDCGLEMTVCNCGASLLNKSGVEDYVKLINYSVRHNSVGKRAMLYLKRHKNDNAFSYFASQIAFAAKARMNRMSETATAAVSYVPRSNRSKVRYGFDQSEELAKRIASRLGVKCVSLFKRRNKGKTAQKKLGLAERRKNAEGSYAVNTKVLKKLEGVNCIFIVDDIMTSGASLYGCISALKGEYNGRIVCVTLARTGKKSKK